MLRPLSRGEQSARDTLSGPGSPGRAQHYTAGQTRGRAPMACVSASCAAFAAVCFALTSDSLLPSYFRPSQLPHKQQQTW